MTPFTLETYRDGISQVAIAVYQTMLDIELRPAAEFESLPRNSFTGAVYYAGNWKGAYCWSVPANRRWTGPGASCR